MIRSDSRDIYDAIKSYFKEQFSIYFELFFIKESCKKSIMISTKNIKQDNWF